MARHPCSLHNRSVAKPPLMKNGLQRFLRPTGHLTHIFYSFADSSPLSQSLASKVTHYSAVMQNSMHITYFDLNETHCLCCAYVSNLDSRFAEGQSLIGPTSSKKNGTKYPMRCAMFGYHNLFLPFGVGRHHTNKQSLRMKFARWYKETPLS